MDVGEQVQAAGGQVGLFGQFAQGRRGGGFLACVEQPGRQLPHPAADRVAVLADEQDAGGTVRVLIEGHHPDGADVDHVVAGVHSPAGHHHLVGDQPEHPVAEPFVAFDHLVVVGAGDDFDARTGGGGGRVGAHGRAAAVALAFFADVGAGSADVGAGAADVVAGSRGSWSPAA